MPQTTPPAPSTPTYPLSALILPNIQTFEPNAIPAGTPNLNDPTKPQKLWIDQTIAGLPESLGSDAITYPVTYQAPNATSLPVPGALTMTFEEAAEINFPTSAQQALAQTEGLLAQPFYSGINSVPPPSRALLPAETIIWPPLPGAPFLVGNTANGWSPSGAGSAGSDSTTLAAIYTMVCGIAEKQGVPIVPVS